MVFERTYCQIYAFASLISSSTGRPAPGLSSDGLMLSGGSLPRRGLSTEASGLTLPWDAPYSPTGLNG